MTKTEFERLLEIGYPRPVVEAARERGLPWRWGRWHRGLMTAFGFFTLFLALCLIVSALIAGAQAHPERDSSLTTWPITAIFGFFLSLFAALIGALPLGIAINHLEPLKLRLGRQMIADLDPDVKGGREKRYRRKRPPTERRILWELGRYDYDWRKPKTWVWALGLSGAFCSGLALVAYT